MKNLFKMFSFFTEKRNIKRFIVSFIFVCTLFLVPKNTYALDSSQFGSSSFSSDLALSLNSYFKFNYIIYYSESNSIGNGDRFNFILFDNATDVCLTEKGAYSWGELQCLKNNSYGYCNTITTTINNINNAVYSSDLLFNSNWTYGFSQQNRKYYANLDIKYCSDLTQNTSNTKFDYTAVSCPVCEECEECETCEGGGPVEVSNFPISTT